MEVASYFRREFKRHWGSGADAVSVTTTVRIVRRGQSAQNLSLLRNCHSHAIFTDR